MEKTVEYKPEPPVPNWLRRFDYVNIWQDGEVYLRRFYPFKWTHKIKIHQIFKSDLDRDLHDHPWNFFTLMLGGGYWEERPVSRKNPDGPTKVKYHNIGTFRFRRATDLHKLFLDMGPAITFVISSGKQRQWGFQTLEGWVPWEEYLNAGEVVPATKYTLNDGSTVNKVSNF